jgi:hypothetical protein
MNKSAFFNCVLKRFTGALKYTRYSADYDLTVINSHFFGGVFVDNYRVSRSDPLHFRDFLRAVVLAHVSKSIACHVSDLSLFLWLDCITGPPTLRWRSLSFTIKTLRRAVAGDNSPRFGKRTPTNLFQKIYFYFSELFYLENTHFEP